MSHVGTGYDINQTFIIEPLDNGIPLFSACTALYTNNILSCSGNTQIFLDNGVITFDGNLYTNDDLTANTINASTYYSGGTSLIDIISFNNITGGTFNNTTDTLTLYKQNNSTVVVTGFTDYFTTGATLIGSTVYFDRNDALSAYTLNLSTFSADTYVTGVTFSNNQLIIGRNDGVNLNTFINTFTGLTVNGIFNANSIIANNISATTISASTFYGNGSNLTGISTQDTFVTGGTYNSGTTVFTNNTGGTFSVTGFYTGYTAPIDVFVTGGTYSTGNATFTNNTGGTFSVTGFSTSTGSSFTGGTVSGSTVFTNGLTANTFSATTYQNLPLDIHVTGATYSNNTFTFTNNTGGTYNVLFNIVTGLTATTLSATTYLGLPTDIRVTGGTYSNGSATFTNNTGGTFSVTGFKTSDVFVTGGTYTNGNAIFTNNTGGTFSVTGFPIGGGGGQLFYLNISQSKNGNRYLSTTASTASEQSTGTTIGAGATGTIASFQSDQLNTTLIPGGIWSFYLHSYKQNNNAAFNIFVEVYKLSSGGTQTLLFTTDPTPVTTNSPNPSMQLSDAYFSGSPITITDSILAVVRATNTSNQSHTITLVSEGLQHYSYVVSTLPTQQGLTCDTLSGCSIIQTIQSNLNNKLDKSGGTITGNLVINGELTATTISATTYLNTPYWVSGSTGNYSIRAKNDTSIDATGNYSLAEGNSTTASGDISHAEGYLTQALGYTSHAEGGGTTAGNSYAHAEGFGTQASGVASHAEGNVTTAIGAYSHAEGEKMSDTSNHIAQGNASHIEGGNNIAYSNYSHGEGTNNLAIGIGTHVEGYNNKAGSPIYPILTYVANEITLTNDYTTEFSVGDVIGLIDSTGEGLPSGVTRYLTLFTIANIIYKVGPNETDIVFNPSLDPYSSSPLYVINLTKNQGANISAHAEGQSTTASGWASHSEGFTTIASGITSHAEGYVTIASGDYSHAEGNYTTASGDYSHSEGNQTRAIGESSHAEGYGTFASGLYSHAGGALTEASGGNSFVHGSSSQALGISTVVFGDNIIGTADNTVYVPYFNIQYLSGGTSVNNLGIDANGYVVAGTAGGGTFTGGTVNGATVFTNGLTANTLSATTIITPSILVNANGLRATALSATTYLNLPLDIRVTGGTYSSGTAIFTNNTGGTFSVTGFSTSTSGSFTGGTVSGATVFTNGLSANTFTLTSVPVNDDTTTQILSRDATTGAVEYINYSAITAYNYGLSFAIANAVYLT